MKYIYRDIVVFEYIDGKVIQYKVGDTAAFDYCRWITEDYKLLSDFFALVWRHKNGEDVDLKDIVVS